MTTRGRSFRAQLAARIAAALGVIVVLGAAGGYWALRTTLYGRLDGILLRLASIEVAATSDSPNESVHFHDDVFVGTGGSNDSVLVRYAEVWTLGGDPVVRTANLGDRHLSLPANVRQRVEASERAELFTIALAGERYRSVLYPLGLVGPQHQAHLLQVATPTRDTEATLRRVGAFLAALALLGFALGGALGWWLAGYAERPVLAIIHEAEAMDASHHWHRITVEADTSELRRLVAVLNGMLGRMDTLIEGQRQFLADAGHAIKTPLTVLRGDVDVALRHDRDPSEYRRVLEQSSADLRDVSALADDLIALARSDGLRVAVPGPAAVVPVDLLLDALESRFGQSAERAGIGLSFEATPGLTVAGDQALLERALGNVVDNSVKYSGSGARVTITAAPDADRRVILTVTDDGPGIPDEEQAQVFHRFYRGVTGRRGAPGSGLGLAIARASVEGLGGDVSLRSVPGRGTTVEFRCSSGEVSSP